MWSLRVCLFVLCLCIFAFSESLIHGVVDSSMEYEGLKNEHYGYLLEDTSSASEEPFVTYPEDYVQRTTLEPGDGRSITDNYDRTIPLSSWTGLCYARCMAKILDEIVSILLPSQQFGDAMA